MSSMPFRQLKSFLKILIGVQYERLLGFQVQGHFVRQTKNALPSSFQKLSRAFCSLSDWKATCKPPVPFDGNKQLAEKSCYHFAIKSAVANQKVVISLGLFCHKYHGFFIPTRCRDSHIKQFCLEDIVPAILIHHSDWMERKSAATASISTPDGSFISVPR